MVRDEPAAASGSNTRIRVPVKSPRHRDPSMYPTRSILRSSPPKVGIILSQDRPSFLRHGTQPRSTSSWHGSSEAQTTVPNPNIRPVSRIHSCQPADPIPDSRRVKFGSVQILRFRYRLVDGPGLNDLPASAPDNPSASA